MEPFHDHNFKNDPNFVYVGSLKNPTTGREYDFYFASLHDSWTAVHSAHEADYGSGTMSINLADAHIMEGYYKDMIFGIVNGYLSVKRYLDTGLKLWEC